MGALNDKIFAGIVSDHAYAFQRDGTTGNWITTPLATTSGAYTFPGLTGFAGSSNGTSNEIMWATANVSGVGHLLAFNATTFALLWDSGTLASDALDSRVKYSAPTVANGRLRVAAIVGSGSSATGEVQVYGVMPLATVVGPKVGVGGGTVIR